MITQINKLRRFGIYQNYTWGAIDDFKHKNLVYGWNYSGKTTLSKLFQVLEFKDKNKCFSGSEIEISINDGTTKIINQDSLASFPFIVKVFNSEYIKRIFVWDEPKTGFSPIAFYLGDEAGDLKKKVKKLETVIERLTYLRDKTYKTVIDSFENYNKQNGKFTEKAKDIRDNYLPGIFDPTTFNKGDFKRIVDDVKDDLENNILSANERDLTKSDATAEKKFETQNERLAIKENLTILIQSIKEILEDTAPKSISLPLLEEDTALFDWVQQGVALHKESKDCKFCTKELPDDRIDNLNSFYSKKLEEIQDAIDKAAKLIEAEKQLIEVKFAIKKDIAEPFQTEYEEALQSYINAKGKYISQLALLENDLKRKGSSIFTSIRSTDTEIISLKSEFDKIEAVIKKHNEWLDKFAERKEASIKKILKHYVAEYLKAENYNQKETDRDCASQITEKINAKVNANLILISSYNAKLSDRVKGQKELNDNLEILLHRNDIKIEIKDEKFRLERSGHPAENLSEGEKSAIAFAYFLTELKALRNDIPSKLPKTIIFLDDPISSLDSNHIFQVRSLLKDFFKTDDFAQLFISTHNFEFFSMLMDSEELFRSQGKTKADFYFIKRNDSGESKVEHLPESFRKYNSEYVSLFHILNDYNNLPDKSTFSHTILLPNAMRRFLELYTAMRYPSSKSIDSRVKKVFTSDDGTYHRVKLLHWFSHQNQFEKVQKHDDKLLQIEEAIKDLLEHIEVKDELHWKGLNGIV